MRVRSELQWWKASAYWLLSWFIVEIATIAVVFAAVGIDLAWAPCDDCELGKLLGIYLLAFMGSLGVLATLITLPLQSTGLHLLCNGENRRVMMAVLLLTTVSSAIASALFLAAAPSVRLSVDAVRNLVPFVFLAIFGFHALVLTLGHWLAGR